MRGTKVQHSGSSRAKRIAFACIATMAMLIASLVPVGGSSEQRADARGPAYDGPQTQANGPAEFGPAPNPLPYCDNPTYFDAWNENVNPIGSIDVGFTTTVSNDGIDMTFTLIDEGDPGGQYPGFFPFGAQGIANDQPKGVEMAEGDAAIITLNKPLFFSQWIFTDVDQPSEGFEVVPDWTEVGEVVGYGGDGAFTFAQGGVDSTPTLIFLDDQDGVGHDSEDVAGRAQIDLLGAVNGIRLERSSPSQGQSGAVVAGGCEASGTAKRVLEGPTWNGTSFDVTYELRMRNNLPKTETILAVVEAAQANAQTTFSTNPNPPGIPLQNLQLVDDLSDAAFSEIEVLDVATAAPGLVLNTGYDGLATTDLLLAGSSIPAETDALITLQVQYTPDLGQATWTECSTGYDYENQSVISGTAANVPVNDESDDGIDPTPSSTNGSGGVDDPTPVLFPCIPAGLDIVKTVYPGAGVPCVDFAGGVPGPGETLEVTVDDFVTYCVTVQNTGVGTATNVTVTDTQAPNAFPTFTLPGGQERTFTYDVQVNLNTQTTNTATVTGQDPFGALGPEADTAVILVSPKPLAGLEIVKSVYAGAGVPCLDFAGGEPGPGVAVPVVDGETVTYCISVRNAGPGVATGVVVSDTQTTETFDLGTLAVGEEAGALTYDVLVNLGTDTTNTASVTGVNPDESVIEPVTDDAVIVISQRPLPVLEIVKTALKGAGQDCPAFEDGVFGRGDAVELVETETVTYCISIRNTGLGDATNVVIADDQATNTFDFNIGDLAAGAGLTRTYDLPDVTVDTPTVNLATVNGDGPYGEVDGDSDEALILVELQPDPVLEIVKTVIEFGQDCPPFDLGVPLTGDALPVFFGETVTYCLSIRNTGPTDADSVRIEDTQRDTAFVIGALDSGQTLDRSYDVLVEQDTDELNTATVFGRGPNGDLDEKSDTAEIDPRLRPDPVLEIVKTAIKGDDAVCPAFEDGEFGRGDPVPVNVDETVTYCISIRNNGPTTATDVTINDPQSPENPYDIGSLAPGAGATRFYTVKITTQTDQVNVAVVDGQGPNGDLPDASDDAAIEITDARAANIELVHTVIRTDRECSLTVKDIDILVVDLEGLDVRWCFQITNTGNVPLTNVTLDAPAVGIIGIDALLNAGQSLIIEQSEPLQGQANLLPEGVTFGSANADPAIVLMPLDLILLDIETFIPGGGLRSIANVIADPSDADGNVIPDLDPVTDQDDSEVREGLIKLTKSVVAGADGNCDDAVQLIRVETGDPVTWCFEVENTGTINLEVLEIVDETLDLVVTVPDDLQIMEPEAIFTIKESGVSPGPIVNVATVAGTAVDELFEIIEQAPIVRDSDDAEIELPQADLAIDKTVSNEGPVLRNTELTYVLTVTNEGTDTALDVKVTDDVPPGLNYLGLPGNDDWVCALDDGERGFTCLKETPMAADDISTLTYTVIVATDAPFDSSFENTATVSASTPDPNDENNTDTARTRTPGQITVVVSDPPVVDPPPPVVPQEPDEVLGLAVTGSSSRVLGLVSTLMLSMGGLLMVGARRRRQDEFSTR